MQDRPIGLLAGWGRLPFAFAEKARSVGLPVVCVGIRGEASSELSSLVRRFHWTGPAQLGRTIRLFKRAGVEQIVMAGKVHKARWVHRPWKLLTLLPDWRTVRWWCFRPRRNNSDDSILLSIIDEFRRDGLHVESALALCPELLVKPGILTRRRPTSREESDIAFGWELAKQMGRLDVGQSVAVKARCWRSKPLKEPIAPFFGELCRAGGFVVVKVAKPQQDMRFDVPTVGCTTIESLYRAGGRVLAIEAEKTIMLDQTQTLALADRYELSIVALPERLGQGESTLEK